MHNHGRGPKVSFVGVYGRWQRGRFRHVASHMRGSLHRASFCPSILQLFFGF